MAPSAAAAAVLPTRKHELRVRGRFVLTDEKSAEPLTIHRPQRRTHDKNDEYNGPISDEHAKYYRGQTPIIETWSFGSRRWNTIKPFLPSPSIPVFTKFSIFAES